MPGYFDPAYFDSAYFDTGEVLPFVRVQFGGGFLEDRTSQRGQPGYRKAGHLEDRYK